jgi:glycosyltransferase involved in cell wall biosynthesis
MERDHPRRPTALRLLSIGTVEPRKNYAYAARILRALRGTGFADATLEIVGRDGWGDDWKLLEREPGVILAGYKSAEEVRQRLQQADALLCTSHEEGLGLPLLEAQYAGLPIIAPDDAIFHEVLDCSGIFIDRTDAGAAAATIAATIQQEGHAARYRYLNTRNLGRWNALAGNDRQHVSQMIASLIRPDARPAPRRASRVGAPSANTH